MASTLFNDPCQGQMRVAANDEASTSVRASGGNLSTNQRPGLGLMANQRQGTSMEHLYRGDGGNSSKEATNHQNYAASGSYENEIHF